MRNLVAKDKLLLKLKGHLPKLSKEYNIKSLGVFGSYVRGEQKKTVIWIFLLSLIKLQDCLHLWE